MNAKDHDTQNKTVISNPSKSGASRTIHEFVDWHSYRHRRIHTEGIGTGYRHTMEEV